ncbi:hypothetical protein DFJ74DRAFT_723241 [Hyaloraphidium curvatum]|nr:hypothetical protein DFJ74DRAFT_723241 [Hyaloraphidium curvatum]
MDRPSAKPCRFFARGRCRAGDSCRFSHSALGAPEPCRFFASGACRFGERCRFAHDAGQAVAGAAALEPAQAMSKQGDLISAGESDAGAVSVGEAPVRQRSGVLAVEGAEPSAGSEFTRAMFEEDLAQGKVALAVSLVLHLPANGSTSSHPQVFYPSRRDPQQRHRHRHLLRLRLRAHAGPLPPRWRPPPGGPWLAFVPETDDPKSLRDFWAVQDSRETDLAFGEEMEIPTLYCRQGMRGLTKVPLAVWIYADCGGFEGRGFGHTEESKTAASGMHIEPDGVFPLRLPGKAWKGGPGSVIEVCPVPPGLLDLDPRVRLDLWYDLVGSVRIRGIRIRDDLMEELWRRSKLTEVHRRAVLVKIEEEFDSVERKLESQYYASLGDSEDDSGEDYYSDESDLEDGGAGKVGSSDKCASCGVWGHDSSSCV